MKKLIDEVVNTLSFGQLFVDSLEACADELRSQNINFFRYSLKSNSQKVIKEFRDKVNQLFDKIPEEGRSGVIQLYDINYELWNKINELSMEEKTDLLNNWDKQ